MCFVNVAFFGSWSAYSNVALDTIVYRRNLELNVYDFDKTIYKGDSYTHFYLYCLMRRPYIILLLPFQAVMLLLAFLKVITRGKGKELFSVYLRFTGNNEALAEKFWKKRSKGIKKWYMVHKQSNDVIISASPEFLLRPICASLGITNLIATRMDSRTGKFSGENCYGEEKPLRFREMFGDAKIAEFYSDSESDTPMARLAMRAYLVKGDNLSAFFKS